MTNVASIYADMPGLISIPSFTMLDDNQDLITKPQEFIAKPQELRASLAGSCETNQTSSSVLGNNPYPSRRGSWAQYSDISSRRGSLPQGYSESFPVATTLSAPAISSTAPVSSTVLPAGATSNVLQSQSFVPILEPVMADIGQSSGMPVLPTLAAQGISQMTSTLAPLQVVSENPSSSGMNVLPTLATQGVSQMTSTPALPQVVIENWQSSGTNILPSLAEQVFAQMTSTPAPLQVVSENGQSSNVTVRPAVWPKRATSSLSSVASLPATLPAEVEATQSSAAVLKEKIVEVPCVQTRVEETCVEVPLIQEVERYIPVPLVQVQEVVKQVPKLSFQEKIVAVPQIETKIEERVVEIPQIQEIERRVFVPQVEVQEVERKVPVVSVKEKIVPVPHVTTRITERIVEVPEVEEVTKYLPVPQVHRQEIIRTVPKKVYTERVVPVPVPVPQVQQPVSLVTRTGPALIYEGAFCADIADGGDGYRLGPPVAIQVDGYAGDYLGGLSPGVMSPVLSPNPSFAPVAGVGDFSGSFGRAPLVGFPPISPVGSVAAPMFSSSIEAAVGGYMIAAPVTALDIPIGQYYFQPPGR